MSKSIGGISLDDIYAASDDLNVEDPVAVKAETAKNPEKKTVSSTAIGGIELDAIMAAADIDEADAVKINNSKAQPEAKNSKAESSIQVKDDKAKSGPSIEFTKDIDESRSSLQTLDIDDSRSSLQTSDVDTDKDNSNNSLIKEIIERKNPGLIIWIILNIVLGGFGLSVLMLIFGIPPFGAFLFALAEYPVVVYRMGSKWGDRKLRRELGLIPWHQLPELGLGYEANKIEDAFNEVYKKAKERSPQIADVELFLYPDESINAFAVGKRTVAVTQGMINMPPDQIKAILAHEFGHLAHKDTEILLIPQAGNFIITIVVKVISFFLKIIGGMFDICGALCSHDDSSFGFFRTVGKVERFINERVLGWWMSLGTIMCTKNNKSNEFAADRYSCKLGYGESLKRAFLTMETGQELHGYFATLFSTHPATPERVMEINQFLNK